MTEPKTPFEQIMKAMSTESQKPEPTEFDAADYADQAVTILNTVRQRLIDAGWNQETAEMVAFSVWQRGRR